MNYLMYGVAVQKKDGMGKAHIVDNHNWTLWNTTGLCGWKPTHSRTVKPPVHVRDYYEIVDEADCKICLDICKSETERWIRNTSV